MPGDELNMLLDDSKQKEVQEVWVLSDIEFKSSCKDIEKKAKKLGSEKLVAMYVMCTIKDKKSFDFLSNYLALKNGV